MYGDQKQPESANDLGPDTVGVSSYPKSKQKGYRIFQAKCTVCHSAARALNSEFVTQDEWSRYIKRMWLRPPCCDVCPVIHKEEARAIREFLVYDSEMRKTGSNALNWKAHRQMLLEEFKVKYPEKYQEMYGTSKQKEGS